jgi:hypothetical protein
VIHGPLDFVDTPAIYILYGEPIRFGFLSLQKNLVLRPSQLSAIVLPPVE